MGNFLTNFGSTAENIAEILRKFLKFLNDFVKLFRILMLVYFCGIGRVGSLCRHAMSAYVPRHVASVYQIMNVC